jgi:hypothetical protein
MGTSLWSEQSNLSFCHLVLVKILLIRKENDLVWIG